MDTTRQPSRHFNLIHRVSIRLATSSVTWTQPGNYGGVLDNGVQWLKHWIAKLVQRGRGAVKAETKKSSGICSMTPKLNGTLTFFRLIKQEMSFGQ